MVSDATLAQLHRQRERRVKAAERASGYKEGRFTIDGLLCETRVTFYPDEAWWLDIAGRERQPLTDELWAKLVPYPAKK